MENTLQFKLCLWQYKVVKTAVLNVYTMMFSDMQKE